MKADYITSNTPLSAHLIYPRFLLGIEGVRLTAKEVYAIMLNMTLDESGVHTDQQGRKYLTFFNKEIAEIIDRTPSTAGQSLRELQDAGLVEMKLIARSAPYHVYVKLPAGEGKP